MRARVKLCLEARSVKRLPCADVPNFYEVVLACRDHVALISAETGTCDLIEVSVRNRMHGLRWAGIQTPEAHLFQVRGGQDGL